MTYWYTVGVKPYPWTTEQLEQLCHLRRDLKLSYPQIVKELRLDVSTTTVRNKCEALLGKEEARIAPGGQYRSFEEARDYVRQLGLQSKADWSRWSREERPDFIPSSPWQAYEGKWVSMGDWLGTGRKSAQEISEGFFSFEEAREYVRRQGLQSKADWKRWSREERPDFIPGNPGVVYSEEGWQGCLDWIGTDFLSFEEARAWVQEHVEASTQGEWQEWAKSPARPDFIHSNPQKYYKGEGWANWGHWLGTGRKSKREISEGYLSFEKARDYVRKLGLLGWDDWQRWSREERPDFIPGSPWKHYKAKWINITDWTEYPPTEEELIPQQMRHAIERRVRKPWTKGEMFSYGEAKRLIRQVAEEGDWTSLGDVYNWLRSDRRPEYFPPNPQTFYGDWWQDWDEFLGMEGFEPGATSGCRVVGARPWQILHEYPTPESRSDAPFLIYSFTTLGQWNIEINSKHYWQLRRSLPANARMVALAILMDMLTPQVAELNNNQLLNAVDILSSLWEGWPNAQLRMQAKDHQAEIIQEILNDIDLGPDLGPVTNRTLLLQFLQYAVVEMGKDYNQQEPDNTAFFLGLAALGRIGIDDVLEIAQAQELGWSSERQLVNANWLAALGGVRMEYQLPAGYLMDFQDTINAMRDRTEHWAGIYWQEIENALPIRSLGEGGP